jgi:hypothetical protein
MKAALLEKVKIFFSGKALFLRGICLEPLRYFYNKTYMYRNTPGFTQLSKEQRAMNAISNFHGYTKPLTNRQG